MDVKAIQKPEHLETTHTVYGQKRQIKKQEIVEKAKKKKGIREKKKGQTRWRLS
jgi:hypothetical protein